MQEVFSIVSPFDKLLGKQPFATDTRGQYRPITYCVTERIPEGILLFSTLTKNMVLLSDAEMDSIRLGGSPLSTLVEEWFYVLEGHDDKTLSRQVRNVARMLLPPVKGYTSYTIFTTTDCNARCFYCYEKNARRIVMSPNVAEKTAGFIAEHCNGKEVALSWFGGEPLYNMEAIDIICRRLEERGVFFHSKMTSNGYLFDKVIIRKAREKWKLRHVQITLDGTEDVYNKAKAYIYEGVNAFQRVIENIHLLLAAGIAVDIRLNIDTYNAEDLMDLSNLLKNDFSGERGLLVYVHPLFGDTKHYAVDDTVKRKAVYRNMELLQDALESAGLYKINHFGRSIKTNWCMADSPRSLSVLPSGQLGKCEHYTDEFYVGHIDRQVELDQEEVSAFKQSDSENVECNSCPMYPDCFRLVRCGCKDECNLEFRTDWLRQIRYGMRMAYYATKKNVAQEAAITETKPC